MTQTHLDGSDNIAEAAQDDAIIGRALKWSLLAIVGFVGCALAIAFWLSRPDTVEVGPAIAVELPETRGSTTSVMPRVWFTDVTHDAGITFIHENGAVGDKLLPETMGGGCAFLDHDNDGDQDLLLVNSSHWPDNAAAALDLSDNDLGDDDGPLPTMALYENDGNGIFRDVTTAVGLQHTFYGMGIAVGDYDNDGDTDVFISAVGPNHLFRNDNGKFVEASSEAGLVGDENAWSTSSGWFDYDNDGDLDLYVCNYVRWSREIDLAQDFRLTGIGRAYGPPMSFAGGFPFLYRNDGGGKFTDVSAESGVKVTNRETGVPVAKSLGLAPIDLDRDGWIDLVVANDTVRNLVFHNQRDGTFREVGIEAGIAFDSSGKARGAMGIDVSCFRDDGSVGVAIANFANEMTALYVSSGSNSGSSSGSNLLFTDDAIPTGLGPPTRMELSFGLFFFDYDLDGRLDLLAANGHLESEINKVQESQHYQQPARLFWNAGADELSEFASVQEENCGPDLMKPIVGRGAAYADIDNDGDLDVLLTQVGGRPLLLRNDQDLGHHYLRFRLIGGRANRDAIGAWIEVRVGETILRRQVMPTRSYLSQVELPVTIGIGNNEHVDDVTVFWPDGTSQKVTDYALDGVTVVTQQ